MIEGLFRKIKIWQILAAAACLYAAGLTAQVSVGGDDSLYVLMSRNIFKPVEGYYCFLFPLLLAPFSLFAPDGFLLMKVIPLMSAVSGLGLFYLLLRRWMPPERARLLVLVCAVNPWIVEHAGLILTEMPFLALSMAALLFVQRHIEAGRGKDRALAALFVALCVYARPFGIVFIPAVLLFFILQRRWKDVLFYALVFVCVFVPVIYRPLQVIVRESVLRTELYSSHFEPVSLPQALGRIVHTAGTYIGSYLPDIFLKYLSEGTVLRHADGSINPWIGLKIALGCLLFSLIVIGAARTARRRLTVVHYYVAMHFALGLLINAYVARYLVPLVPFLIWFFLEGIQPAPRTAARVTGVAAAVLFTVFLLNSGMYLWQARVAPVPARSAGFVECNRWIKEHAPVQALVLSRKSSYSTLVSGRPAMKPVLSKSVQEQVDFIVSRRIDYVIVGDPEPVGVTVKDVLMKAMESRPDLFIPVYVSESQPADYVYKVNREGPLP